jgi:hypothetical protein
MESKNIYTSRKKGLLLFVGSCIFVAIGISLALFPDRFLSRYPESVVFSTGIICTLFFSACAIASLRILLFKKIALSITATGIVINPGKKRTTALQWNEISGFKEINVATQKFIAVMLANPANRLEAETNGFSKRMLNYNFKNYGSPYCFSANAYDTNHKALLSTLNEALHQYNSNKDESDRGTSKGFPAY